MGAPLSPLMSFILKSNFFDLGLTTSGFFILSLTKRISLSANLIASVHVYGFEGSKDKGSKDEFVELPPIPPLSTIAGSLASTVAGSLAPTVACALTTTSSQRFKQKFRVLRKLSVSTFFKLTSCCIAAKDSTTRGGAIADLVVPCGT